MSQRNARELLLQLDFLEDTLPRMGKSPWQTLYSNTNVDGRELTIWCALLQPQRVAAAMTDVSWDLPIGNGLPCFSQSSSSGKTVTTYHRFGGTCGVRPLVLYRSFGGAFPPYFEIDEEFRLYHELADDKNRGLLLSFDGSGREIEVARITEQKVSARLKYLRQFQAGTGLHLALYFESHRYSEVPLVDVPKNERERTTFDDRVVWHRAIVDCDFKADAETFSRLLGKVILPPPPRDNAGVWPFAEDRQDDRDVKFIVSTDSNGDPIESTSNPEQLANYFGANPDAYQYLTPVYFRREVLGKYFAEPDRYRVADGQLSCLSLWSCRIDNDLDSHVVMFLGDLGRDLPYEERLHWRQFNVLPEGGVSETQFRRGFLAEFADAKAPDLVFRREYASLLERWPQMHGWPLFLAPAVGDRHLLATIRVPVTDSQSELDEQIMCLTKLLVDSLNERELAVQVGGSGKSLTGIAKLSAFLEKTGCPHSSSIVEFLRDLQALRSTGSAHRKGRSYAKRLDKLGLSSTTKADMCRHLLATAAAALRTLRHHYCEDAGRHAPDEDDGALR